MTGQGLSGGSVGQEGPRCLPFVCCFVPDGFSWCAHIGQAVQAFQLGEVEWIKNLPCLFLSWSLSITKLQLCFWEGRRYPCVAFGCHTCLFLCVALAVLALSVDQVDLELRDRLGAVLLYTTKSGFSLSLF